MGRSDGHPWGDPVAASGDFRWPPTGRFPWPPSLFAFEAIARLGIVRLFARAGAAATSPSVHPDRVMRGARRATTMRTPPPGERSAPLSEPTSADREVLPIPDRPYDGPVFEDAKDPAAKFPPIEPLRPPAGAPNVLIVLIDDAGFGCASAFGGPCQTPTAERLAGEGLKFTPLPHDGAVLADARGAAVGPQPPHGRDGRDHGDRDLGARLQLGPPEHVRAAGGDAEAQRLRDRAVRQVPRGAGVGDEPARPVRLVAERRGRLRVLLRLHRRGDQPVLPGAVRGDDAGRARQDPGGGLPLHRGHDRPGDQVDPPAEGADGGQALLRLLRARSDARAASRARPSGRRSTRASSTRAGTRCARRRSPARRSSA